MPFKFVGHTVKAHGEMFNFVAGVNIELFVQITAGNFADAVSQLINRRGQFIGNFARGKRNENHNSQYNRRSRQKQVQNKIVQHIDKTVGTCGDNGAICAGVGNNFSFFNADAETPARTFQRRISQIMRHAVNRNQIHSAFAVSHFLGNGGKFKIFAVKKARIVHQIFVVVNFEFALFARRKNYIAVFVHDKSKAGFSPFRAVDDIVNCC